MALIERFTPGGNLYPDGSSSFAMLVQAFRRIAEQRDIRDAAMNSAWEAGDRAGLSSARSYADQRASSATTSAVTSAKTYTDSQVSAVETRATGSAKTYTDSQVNAVQAGVVTNSGIDAGVDRALNDGRIDTAVNDNTLATLVRNALSASSAALREIFDDQYSRTSILYVDPVNGDDTRTGASWKKAKKSIQAAVDAAPKGAEIVLAPGGHVVGTGVACDDNTKCLTIRGASPLVGRQHADQTWGQTHIRSGLTGEARPMSLLRVGTETSTNIYGWTFRNLYFEAGSLQPDGACIETHGVSRALVQDVSARCLGTAEMTRWLLKTDGGAGNDAAWWHCDRISTYGVRFLHSRKGNYWTFSGVSIMGNTGTPRAAGPAMDITGSQHNLNGLHLEGWDTGVLATNCRGLLGHGIMSEWVGTLLHMVGVRDSIISVNSSAGAGASEVLDENGTNNTVIGAPHRKTGTTSGAHSVSNYGTSPSQLAGGSATPIYGPHPTRPTTGVEMLPAGSVDIMGSAPIVAEYHNGTDWVAWPEAETGYLSVANTQAITVDAAHKRCRFRSANLFGAGQGLGYVRLTQSQGTPSTVTFRMWPTDRVTPTFQYSAVLDEPAQKRGAFASFPSSFSATFYEVEFDFGLTGGQTATVQRVQLFATDVHQNVRGRQLRGPKSPLNLIQGAPGDIYHCAGNSATDPAIGLWAYAPADGAVGTAGWKKLAYAA